MSIVYQVLRVVYWLLFVMRFCCFVLSCLLSVVCNVVLCVVCCLLFDVD